MQFWFPQYCATVEFSVEIVTLWRNIDTRNIYLKMIVLLNFRKNSEEKLNSITNQSLVDSFDRFPQE